VPGPKGRLFCISGKQYRPFATDYQAIGINPANLGWSGKFEDKKVTFGIGELTSSLYSNALTKEELFDNFLRDNDVSFTYAQKQQAAASFAGADFTSNIDVRSFGLAFTTEKAGGFAFHTAERVQWWSKFGKETSEILFLGRNAPYFDHLVLSTGDTVSNNSSLSAEQRALGVRGLSSSARNITQIMDGSAITHQWVREYALAWGYNMGTSGAWTFYGGTTARYLQGVGMMDIRSEGGKLTAFSALSPGYDINYGDAALSNPSTVTGSGFKSVGSGFAADIGFSAEMIGKAKVGVSYTNIGSMRWDGNVYEAYDEKLYALESDGFISYNFLDEAELIASDVGILEWQGLTEKKVATPSQLRTGGSIKVKEKTELGFDIVIPTNDAPGNLESPMNGSGGEVAVLPWMSVNTGVATGGMYKTMVPFGLNVHPGSGSWEAGFATRDIISTFSQEPGLISYCVGFLRFRV
jgi:hypothetical protein